MSESLIHFLRLKSISRVLEENVAGEFEGNPVTRRCSVEKKLCFAVPISACSYGLRISRLAWRLGGSFERFHPATGPENKNKAAPRRGLRACNEEEIPAAISEIARRSLPAGSIGNQSR